MPTVPSFNAGATGQSPLSAEQPSPENLLMAAAIMHQQGKFEQPQPTQSKSNRKKNPSLKVIR